MGLIALIAALQSAAQPAPAASVPRYAVVEAAHPAGPPGWQSMTVLCPGGLKAMGAGFSAVVRTPAARPGAQPGQAESGVSDVRSYPDGKGSGWRVEGSSPEAARLRQPWRLAVRVVCMRVE